MEKSKTHAKEEKPEGDKVTETKVTETKTTEPGGGKTEKTDTTTKKKGEGE